MALSLIILSFLLPPFNSPQDTTLGQRYEAAQELVRAGKLAEAETELKAILAAQYRRLMKTYGALMNRGPALEAAEAAANYQSTDNDLLIELAMAYLEAAQFDKALDPLLRAARLQPNNADVHRTLGKTYFALGDYEKSARALEVAVKLAPKDFNSSFTLAITYLQQRQFTAARRVFDSMIAEFGEHPQIHIAIGRAFREAGRLPEAIDEFKRAIALNSQFPGAHYNLGLAYLWNEGGSAVANAEAEFKIELVANPNDFFSNYYLGITCIFQRKWELAIDFLRTASRIQPNNPDPYFQLGQAYQELKNHDQAIDVLRKAIELNPNLAHNKFQVTTAHYRLAQSLLQIGQTEAGRKELQVASELKARAFEITQSLSSGQSTMGASRLPTENDTRSLPGATETQNALDQKTRSELETNAANLTKIIAALHNSLGLVQAGRQNLAGAAVEFRLAKRWNPQQVGLDYNLGLAFFRAELYREALAPLESEIKSNPANTQARWLLGLCYFNTREYSRAAALLHDVLSSGSTNVELCYALASSLIREQKIDAAEHAVEQMTVLTGTTPRLSQVRYELGKALLERANIAGAVSNLEIAVKLEPENALFHYELGRAYTAAGRREDAKRENETFNRLKTPQ
ncbi:MAG TPA: tetratricopeptide repeat protein [Pyrinomonadaceae bacterium]|nr:tetratricopeptide repeat protein [Pyrinomonadaceae bacterium]